MGDSTSGFHTRPSLLMRLRDQQDAEAWRTFVDIYTPLIYGYCRHCRLQPADAADVTQEVLGKVARSIRTFDYQPERGRFRDWLGIVTRGELIRFIEKMQRQAPAGVSDLPNLDKLQSPEFESAWTDHFRTRLLETSLEQIRPEFEATTWRAFELVWLKGVSAPAAAREMQEPIETIYSAKSRVLKRLQQQVLSLAEDFI